MISESQKEFISRRFTKSVSSTPFKTFNVDPHPLHSLTALDLKFAHALGRQICLTSHYSIFGLNRHLNLEIEFLGSKTLLMSPFKKRCLNHFLGPKECLFFKNVSNFWTFRILQKRGWTRYFKKCCLKTSWKLDFTICTRARMKGMTHGCITHLNRRTLPRYLVGEVMICLLVWKGLRI